MRRRELQPCGTVAAYRRHQNHHEPPCAACAQAMTEYNRNCQRRQHDSPMLDRQLARARRQIRVGELAALGETVSQIAREVGCTAKLVRADLQAMDMTPPPRRGRPKKVSPAGTCPGTGLVPDARPDGSIVCQCCHTAQPVGKPYGQHRGRVRAHKPGTAA